MREKRRGERMVDEGNQNEEGESGGGGLVNWGDAMRGRVGGVSFAGVGEWRGGGGCCGW